MLGKNEWNLAEVLESGEELEGVELDISNVENDLIQDAGQCIRHKVEDERLTDTIVAHLVREGVKHLDDVLVALATDPRQEDHLKVPVTTLWKGGKYEGSSRLCIYSTDFTYVRVCSPSTSTDELKLPMPRYLSLCVSVSLCLPPQVFIFQFKSLCDCLPSFIHSGISAYISFL